VSTDLDEIWCADAKLHADNDERSKSKREVEFQYGGRPFSETGSSNNSGSAG